MHLVFRGQALPLLRRLLHGFAEGLGVLHHRLELRVRQHPQQVVQDQNQLGGHHVTVFNLQQSTARLEDACIMQVEAAEELKLM